MEEIAAQLSLIELFSQVRERDLSRIAALFEQAEYDHDECLTQQGEAGDRFYLLQGGSAAIWRTGSDGVDRLVRHMGPGDYFGVTALFADEARDATVRVSSGSTVWSLERSQFSGFLKDSPTVRSALRLPRSLESRLDAPRFDWMTEDEFTVYYATKTRWALASGLVLPAAILLVLMAGASATRTWPYLPDVLSLLALAVGGGWSVLRWLDWRNDYYVVTNKRVVHHESHLPSLRVTVDQAPLRQIQNVTVLTPGPVARAFHFGSLVIETAGRSNAIGFLQLDRPQECLQILSDWIEKTRSLGKIDERAAIREAIAEQFRPQPSADEQPAENQPAPALYVSGQAVWDLGDAPPPAEDRSETRSLLEAIANAINALLPHFRRQVGQVVIWQKHPFILVRATWLPALILALTFAAGVSWVAMIGGQSFSMVVLVLFTVWCLDLFWFLWQYEDWRNDTFQMSATHVIDVDRLPLGLRETRRQAALEQVQNINVDIPNVWARIFNYGNVVIETAGRTGDLNFEWVMRPRAVQAEIFERIEALRTRQKKEEAEQRRQEMANWLAVYHQMKTEGQI